MQLLQKNETYIIWIWIKMLEMALKKCEPSLMQQYFIISQKTKCIKKRV